jgi:tetratricopeptide (TPR) repeat protein
LARIYFFGGELEKGIDALSVRTLSQGGSFGANFGLLLYVEGGELAKAVQVVRDEQSNDPPPVLDGFSAYCRGAVLEAAGDFKGARQIWTEYVSRLGDLLTSQNTPASLYGLSLNYAKLGNREKAMDYVLRSLAPDPRHPTKLFFASEAHALLGNRREAVDSLKAAVDNGFLNLPMIEGMARCRICTLYSLRNDPEFLAIRAELARRLDELRARY